MNEREKETVAELRALAKGIEDGEVSVMGLTKLVEDEKQGLRQLLEVCTFMPREDTPGR